MEHSNDNSKKRKSDPSSWKRNVVKKKRKSGLSYQNSKGVLVPAKTTGPNSCKCNRECMTSLSLDQQMEVLDRFLGLNTKDEQDVFLQNLIRRSPANRKRHHEGQQPLPRTVLSYNVLFGDKTIEVKLVQAETILDFKGWWARHYKKTPVSIETCGRKAKKEDKVYFGISSFHHFTYSSSSPGMLKARNFIDGLVHHTFALRKATILDLPTAKAYPSGKVPMKQAKVDDVAKLQPYIPEKYRPFFVSLITWPTYSTSQEDEPENEQ
ncbi:hypothetical protein GE061_014393 [Apolygus lucorum]|uniref:Uncharacterized protein n=1 Tax=Apolygus lucorum TaxID=248454 RepID=A0A8S9XT52_APOLU|nr:hypothetical protein GE061_014393 [Apolygus lucorum]